MVSFYKIGKICQYAPSTYDNGVAQSMYDRKKSEVRIVLEKVINVSKLKKS